MGSQSDVRQGRAYVELYVKNSALVRGLADAGRRLKQFGQSISTFGRSIMIAGVAIVGPLLAATKHFMSVGDQLDKMSKRTGVSTNALSELGFAAEQSGTDMESLEKSVRKMQKNITDVVAGLSTSGAEIKAAFAAIGLSVEQLARKSPEEQFMAIGKALNGIVDPTTKAGIAMAIFGKSGTAVLPMLGDMETLRAEAVRLGLSIGPEQAKAAAVLTDAWNRVKRAAGAVAVAIGSELAGTLTKLADGVLKHVADIRRWVSANGELIISIISAAAKVAVFGAAIFALGKVVSTIGAITSASSSLFLSLSALNPVTVTLTASVLALGAAYAYAAKQKLKLTAMDAKEAARNALTRRVEESFATGSLEAVDKELAAMERQKKVAQSRADSAHKKLMPWFSEKKLASIEKNPDADTWVAPAPWARDLVRVVADSRGEVTRLTFLYDNLKKKRDEMAKAGTLRSDKDIALGLGKAVMSGIGSAVAAGKTFGANFLKGWRESWKANRGLFDDIARIRASGIEDPQQREETQLNLEYDAKKREGAEKGLNLEAIEVARQEELKNIRAKYAANRKKSEEDIAYETEEARIRAMTEGQEKELALLRHRQSRERDEAKKARIDPLLLAEKHRYEEMAIPKDSLATRSVAGTFNARAAAQMGGGGGVQERILGEAKVAKIQREKANKINQDMLSEYRATKFAFTA